MGKGIGEDCRCPLFVLLQGKAFQITLSSVVSFSLSFMFGKSVFLTDLPLAQFLLLMFEVWKNQNMEIRCSARGATIYYSSHMLGKFLGSFWCREVGTKLV